MLSKTLPPLILIACVALALWLLQSSPAATSGTSKARVKLQVAVQSVASETFYPRIRTHGRLRAHDEFAITPLVSGQVTYLAPIFKTGNTVQRGDLLVRLDDADYQAALASAQAALIQAELAVAEESARAEQARNDWRKQPQQQARSFALREPHVAAAKAALEEAKSALLLAQRNVRQTTITAQFTGRLTEVLVKEGAFVNTTTTLGNAYAVDKAELPLSVASNDLPWLPLMAPTSVPTSTTTPSMAATSPIVQVFNPLDPAGAPWSGKWVRTGPALNAQTQQVLLIVEIRDPFAATSNASRRPLLMGQYLEAEISGPPINDAIVIDNRHIYQGPFVYVVEEGRIFRRDVTIERQEATRSLISAGLAPGDQLVTTLLGNITSGLEVTLIDASAQAADPASERETQRPAKVNQARSKQAQVSPNSSTLEPQS